MNELLNRFLCAVAVLLAKACAKISLIFHRPSLFYFFPLASIGGTEIVHADIIESLQSIKSRTFIRYRGNVWKGKNYARTEEALRLGSALYPEYSKYSKVSFLSDWFEATRFARIKKAFYLAFISNIINANKQAKVVFWRKEAILEFLPLFSKHVKLIDIVHNLRPEMNNDTAYLNVDIVDKIDKRVAISSTLKSQLADFYEKENKRQFEERIEVIPHTVYIPLFRSKNIGGKIKIIYIGRNSSEKRLHLILSIASKLINTHHFDFIGPSPSEFSIIPENVTIHGEIRDRETINNLLNQAHILILTSSSEGFPKTVAEALAFGTIPVVTKVGAISDYIIDGENGFLIESNSEEQIIEDFTSKLSWLHSNQEIVNSISQKCHETALQTFGKESFSKSWNNIVTSWQESV